MKKIFWLAVCCLFTALAVEAEQPQDKTAALLEKITPTLTEIEQQLGEIETDFWKTVRGFESGSYSYLKTNSVYLDFNRKILDFVKRCTALQGILHDSGVDLERFPVEQQASAILNVWKRLPMLNDRIVAGRRDPITRDGKIELEESCIKSILMTGDIPEDTPDYELVLDDVAVINTELFYVTCEKKNVPPGWESESSELGKYMSEDPLISSAEEYFMALRDLRIIFRKLKTQPCERETNTPGDTIRLIENDLNRIEREFWDTIYKGEIGTTRGSGQSRYAEFRQRLYQLQVNSRNFLIALRRKKIAPGKFNPVTDALTIAAIGRNRDQDLRRQMRRFFNRENPFIPGSKRRRIECLYHFRATNPAAGKKDAIAPFVPHAEIRMMTDPDELDKLCETNAAVFHSEEKEFDVLSGSAAEYFNAVKRLRQIIAHWKEHFASDGKEP